jgi:hypothetical protein
LACAREQAPRPVISHRLFRLFSWCADSGIPELITLPQTIEAWWPETLAFIATRVHAPARRLHPDLRLVRVRTAQGRETPQWWGLNPKDEANGLPSHLWVPQCDGASRVFYSTTPKPAQFRTSAIEADKLAPRRTGEHQGNTRIDTNIPGWNPGLVEIAVLGCHQDDGDDPESLALAVHQLRQPPDYPQALALPLPLHLAGLGQEYVLPTLAEEVEDEATAVGDLRSTDASVIPANDGDPDPAMAAGLFTDPDPEEDRQASPPDV